MNKMKKLLSLMTVSTLSFFCWVDRVQPVSLDRQVPLLIKAEIKGEVQNPGVYELKNGVSVQDLIEEAGGLNEQAETASLVLLKEVSEDEVIVVPAKRNAGEKQLISINTADLDELQTLPGIGPAIAGRIIEYRNQTSFQSLEQIMEVKGIGEKLFEKIRGEICL